MKNSYVKRSAKRLRSVTSLENLSGSIFKCAGIQLEKISLHIVKQFGKLVSKVCQVPDIYV